MSRPKPSLEELIPEWPPDERQTIRAWWHYGWRKMFDRLLEVRKLYP